MLFDIIDVFALICFCCMVIISNYFMSYETKIIIVPLNINNMPSEHL
jgi:hypothetical protein